MKIELSEREVDFIYNALENTMNPNLDPEGYAVASSLLYKIEKIERK